MSLPNTYTSENETNCCPIPNYKDWDNKDLKFEDKHFIRLHTKSFMYMPLNMNKIMKQLDKTADVADAKLPIEQSIVLSRDLSPWRAEQLYRVTGPIEGADNVTLNGEFLSKTFEGPYKEAGKWSKQMKQAVIDKGKDLKALYFFYTTCPKCAKHYGKNYVIGLAGV